MITNVPTRVAELSATLNSIKDYKGASYITGDMIEIAEDCNSYNASFYCNGWIKPIFEGDFKGVILQKVEEYQVLRMYYICTRLEGLAYDEIPEDWDDEDAPDYPEMEITDTIEVCQVWFNQQEQYTISFHDYPCIDDNAYVVFMDSIQDWSFEPKHKDRIIQLVNKKDSFYNDTTSLTYVLSPCAELLAKKAPLFGKCVQSLFRHEDATKYYSSLRIAIRHNYALPTTEEGVRMYLDYLRLLEMAGFCLTEPFYICPKDLHTSHDRLATQRKQLQDEEEKRKAQEKEAEFAEKHSWLFGIEFDDAEFHYQSLDSVEAYRVEGEIMHHCIYRCEYYKKHNHLSMHISDHEGNRVATCTIDLVNRRISDLQPPTNDIGFFKTYGIKWQSTDDYKQIHNTLVARMHTFPKKKKEKLYIKKIA